MTITPTTEQIRRLYELYPAEYRRSLATQYRHVERTLWNSRPDFRNQTPHRAGSMGDFFKKTLPLSADDLLFAYLEAKEDHMRFCAEGLVEMGLESVDGRHSPLATAFLLTAVFLCDRTFTGYQDEDAIRAFINAFMCGYEEVEFLTSEADARYGADLFALSWVEGLESYFIQVKPVSFFRGGPSNPQLQADRRRLFSKVKETKKMTGLEVYWWIVPPHGEEIRPSTKEKPMLLSTDDAWELIPLHCR
ncbi:hypothetical protein ICM05_05320 [Leucobacter sp. cx-42]|uniref:hypothetical protein n=1 Tax=unclassified Leucobacter TaxID=2621730 RepID=UPI00165E03FD|nr:MULTISPECIES: hypothetical protein [unclassified Leucobacter]MBC9954066.1 hypothetical protein [Leucobacter sp. cx-42]